MRTAISQPSTITGASRNRISPSSWSLPGGFRRTRLRARVVVLGRLGELAELFPAGRPRRRLLGGLSELLELLLQRIHVALEFDVLGLDGVELELESVDVLLGGGPPLLKGLWSCFQKRFPVGYEGLVVRFAATAAFFEGASGYGVADFDLLGEEHLHHHPQREPLVLRGVHARVDRQLLAVHHAAQPLPLVLRQVRVRLKCMWKGLHVLRSQICLFDVRIIFTYLLLPNHLIFLEIYADNVHNL